MDALRNIGVARLAVALGIVTALAWIFLPTGAALAMSIVSGGVIALVAMSTGNANTAEAD